MGREKQSVIERVRDERRVIRTEMMGGAKPVVFDILDALLVGCHPWLIMRQTQLPPRTRHHPSRHQT